MSDRNKNLVLKYIEEVWNNANIDTFRDLTKDTFVYILGEQPPRDSFAMKLFLQAVHVTFPDWKVQVEEIVAESNLVAVRWTGKVTHKGIFNGIPPTGKQISVGGINIYCVEDGKIVREWEQMDSLGMLQLIGILPVDSSQVSRLHTEKI